jgi:hypothetical protein
MPANVIELFREIGLHRALFATHRQVAEHGREHSELLRDRRRPNPDPLDGIVGPRGRRTSGRVDVRRRLGWRVGIDLVRQVGDDAAAAEPTHEFEAADRCAVALYERLSEVEDLGQQVGGRRGEFLPRVPLELT